MKYLRDLGYIVARVEQRLHMPTAPFPITRDCFGFGDLLAARAYEQGDIVLVQVTSTGNLNAREQKIREPELWQVACEWLHAGGRIELHGWAKRGPRGKRKVWTIQKRIIALPESLEASAA